MIKNRPNSKGCTKYLGYLVPGRVDTCKQLAWI